MIKGNVTLEDTNIQFRINDLNMAVFTVTDLITKEQETFEVENYKFLKALSIAVHNDGMPQYELDYDDAESIQGKIRWIP